MLSLFASLDWNDLPSHDMQHAAINNLEKGHVLLFPHLAFKLNDREKNFLSPKYADPHSKNISYHLERHQLWGVQRLSDAEHALFKTMMNRYATCAHRLITQLFPNYKDYLTIGRTSFRPVEVCDRKSSYRKDDKRLHVDAFPSAPNQGNRILRVFTNINPQGENRLWRLGEPFEEVAKRFLANIPPPFYGLRRGLRLLRITKSYRSLYDHYMLNIHDRMKADDYYQQHASQQEVAFPPGSSWIVQTDHVSHAAMKGQFVFEQTFYLPVHAMQNPALSPLKVLEDMLGKKLV